MTDCIAIIVASGRGQRFGGGRPKQYMPLLGEALLRHTLECFADHPDVTGVRAVIHPDDRALYDEAVAGLDLMPPVTGGETRQDSGRLGLESLAGKPPEKVLIHDGARPLVDAEVISRVIRALDHEAGALPALPVADTLKRVQGETVGETVDRKGLYRAQTPQGFLYESILSAHRRFEGEAMTDDAAIAEAAGISVAVVAGDEGNIKVTAKDDLLRTERQLMKALRPRTGMGFDVHRLEEVRAADHAGLVLMGLTLPEPFRMIGHSDADVGLHAITDALLGALAIGDIGSHFPPSDPKWKGADSAIFLIHAVDEVISAGGIIEHVDVTLICERPKIGPYRPAMTERLSELLRMSSDRISIKATTTERLGFTGRGEGIAAQAIATILVGGGGRRPRA
ncbi:MAG: bifunctional 2-C-methyl-D-erythritol 4-phosphate cytidylyltransferase/2-C-methyl-D-erythritol 2,4-cyclodiphosphate synthase [Geminicoccaceae bacterium]